jgi:hypothetical protein
MISSEYYYLEESHFLIHDYIIWRLNNWFVTKRKPLILFKNTSDLTSR